VNHEHPEHALGTHEERRPRSFIASFWPLRRALARTCPSKCRHRPGPPVGLIRSLSALRGRADGDRDALRILLRARHDLTTTVIAQINRLRALLRDGDTDRHLARGTLTDATVTEPSRRRAPHTATRAHTVRHGEIRRLASAVRVAGRTR
jgi:hypothetical protein